MDMDRFAAEVETAIAELPPEFRAAVDNVAVLVEEHADSATQAEMALEHPLDLLGLYRDRTAKDEAVEEGRRLAESMNQESLARVEAKSKAAYENDSRAVDLDLDRDSTAASGAYGPGSQGSS